MTKGYGTSGTWLDYLLNCFAGSRPVEISLGSLSSMAPPFGWLMTVSGCLFLNLDYMIGDLTTAGQQMIIRSRQRIAWFFSKCAWNIAGCFVYVLCLFVVTLIYAKLGGSEIDLTKASALAGESYEGFLMLSEISVSKLWLVGIIIPVLTIVSLSLLQMTLCLFVKPIFSFMISMGLLMAGVYVASPWMLTDEAMGIRNVLFCYSDAATIRSIIFPVVVGIGSIIAGVIRFRNTDILGMED